VLGYMPYIPSGTRCAENLGALETTVSEHAAQSKKGSQPRTCRLPPADNACLMQA
jgi:hypothetical protein